MEKKVKSANGAHWDICLSQILSIDSSLSDERGVSRRSVCYNCTKIGILFFINSYPLPVVFLGVGKSIKFVMLRTMLEYSLSGFEKLHKN